MSPKKLFTGSGILLISTFILSGTQWFIQAILARELGLEMFGAFNLLIALATPIFLFSNSNLKLYLIGQKTIPKISYLIRYRSVSIFISVVITLFAAVVFSAQSYIALLIYVVAFKCFESSHELMQAVQLRANRIALLARDQLLRSVALLAPFCLLLVIPSLNLAVALVMLLGGVAALLSYRQTKSIDLEKLYSFQPGQPFQSTFKALLPYSLIAVSESLLVQIPKYGLSLSGLLEDVGVYTAVFLGLQIGGIILSTTCTSILPTVRTLLIDSEQLVQRKKMVRIGALLSIAFALTYVLGMAFGGKLFLSVLYGAKFSLYSSENVWMSVIGFPMYIGVVLSYVMYVQDASVALRKITTNNLVLSLVLASVLIPLYGLIGAIVTYGLIHVFRTGQLLYWNYSNSNI